MRVVRQASSASATLLITKTKTNTIMAAIIGYCVKCKAKRDMKDAKEITMANGRKAMKGVCSVCGTGMFKIMGTKK
jgi:hypothetical protein